MQSMPWICVERRTRPKMLALVRRETQGRLDSRVAPRLGSAVVQGIVFCILMGAAVIGLITAMDGICAQCIEVITFA
jgi:hypothetical protein